jgi:hypothetical protein
MKHNVFEYQIISACCYGLLEASKSYSGARVSGLFDPIMARIMVARAIACGPTDPISQDVGTAITVVEYIR